jgi:hypothetical protein
MSEIGQCNLFDKVHIRGRIGAVICANENCRAGGNLGFSENLDKAVAQMSFVEQVTLPSSPHRARTGIGY